MSKKFNLLLLHEQTDVHPRSWVCLKGEKLARRICKLELKTLKKLKTNREDFSKMAGQRLNCSHSVVKRALLKKTYFPIPILNVLLEHCKHRKREVKKITEETEWLKVNGASAKPIKACKMLTPSLAKILGAFIADGSLSLSTTFSARESQQLDKLEKRMKNLNVNYSKKYSASRKEFFLNVTTDRFNSENIMELIRHSKDLGVQRHHRIDLADYYFDNVEKFNEWIFTTFKINPCNFHKRGNAWRSCFSNKILARYLMVFFGVTPGKKSDIAFEPEVIKESSLEMRKEFAKGVMMFDGCVTISGRMQLESMSPFLIQSIKDIWLKDGVKFGIQKNRKVIYSTLENSGDRIKQYFEVGTTKYDRILMGQGKAAITPRLDNHGKNLSLKKILEVIKEVKVCDIAFLVNKFNVGQNTILQHLRILEKHNKIRLNRTPGFLDARFVGRETGVLLEEKTRNSLFKRMKERFGHYKDTAIFLNVKKATFSTWKLGKIRISVRMMEKMARISKIEKNEIYRNVLSTDRMICSLI